MNRVALGQTPGFEISGKKLYLLESPAANAVGLFFGDPPSIESPLGVMQACLDTYPLLSSNCSGSENVRKLFQDTLLAGHVGAHEADVAISGVIYATSGNWLHVQGVGESGVRLSIYDQVIKQTRDFRYGLIPALGTALNIHQIQPSTIKLRTTDVLLVEPIDQNL